MNSHQVSAPLSFALSFMLPGIGVLALVLLGMAGAVLQCMALTYNLLQQRPWDAPWSSPNSS